MCVCVCVKVRLFVTFAVCGDVNSKCWPRNIQIVARTVKFIEYFSNTTEQQQQLMKPQSDTKELSRVASTSAGRENPRLHPV
jgi:hypothetical protein